MGNLEQFGKKPWGWAPAARQLDHCQNPPSLEMVGTFRDTQTFRDCEESARQRKCLDCGNRKRERRAGRHVWAGRLFYFPVIG